jgi:ribosome production factor 1
VAALRPVLPALTAVRVSVQIVQYAAARGFTSLLVVNENNKRPNGLLLISLPAGPTAHFRLSSLKLRKKIRGAGRPTRHIPELILNNFSTRLGLRVGR